MALKAIEGAAGLKTLTAAIKIIAEKAIPQANIRYVKISEFVGAKPFP